ncbi:MAG: hypothetical protein AB7V56_13210 [Candidatus Nitrosocosmicus sp.]|nr:hypothetical protein [Candidatus Nitrosocosmicus sp.]HET6589119.1 hypothetical protein [Candidatus Nitrosocosmicus sp.]
MLARIGINSVFGTMGSEYNWIYQGKQLIRLIYKSLKLASGGHKRFNQIAVSVTMKIMEK